MCAKDVFAAAFPGVWPCASPVTAGFAAVAGTGPTETEADTALDELPAHWTTGTVYDDGPMSAFATG